MSVKALTTFQLRKLLVQASGDFKKDIEDELLKRQRRHTARLTRDGRMQ